MIYKNYHTHTTYCDGKDTPQEMVKEAIRKGFDAIGFSSHSPLFDDWCMTESQLDDYIDDINSLKEIYKNKIEILCGIEQDYYSSNNTEKFDYVIGSVHCIDVGGTLMCIDDTSDILKDLIDRYFGGDSIKLAEIYYETVGNIAEKTGCDIVGHFDLITKFDDVSPIFDITDARYIKSAKNAIDKLSGQNVVFEVNTGAMSRGLKKTPYPNKELLKYIFERNCDVIISSDCHDKKHIDYAFDDAVELVKQCGFSRVAYITKNGRGYINI